MLSEAQERYDPNGLSDTSIIRFAPCGPALKWGLRFSTYYWSYMSDRVAGGVGGISWVVPWLPNVRPKLKPVWSEKDLLEASVSGVPQLSLVDAWQIWELPIHELIIIRIITSQNGEGHVPLVQNYGTTMLTAVLPCCRGQAFGPFLDSSASRPWTEDSQPMSS